jgi:integrase
MAQATGLDGFTGASMVFTEARIEQARRLVCDGELPTDSAGRRSWRDERCRGLVLTVNHRSRSAVLYFQGTVDGRTVRRAIGDVEGVRLEEARQFVGRLKFDRSAAAVLAPRRAEPEEVESPTVGAVVAAMLDAHEAGSWLPGTRSRVPTDRTMRFYRDLRRARLRDHESLSLAEFAAKLPAIYAAMKVEAPYQGNRFLQLVRNLYAYAADRGLWSEVNPAVGSSKTDRLTRSPEQPRERFLTDAEWTRLDKAMAADEPIWRDLFSISLLTLQRMGACRHMRWSDLTLTGRNAEWRIPAKWVKGRKHGHVVPIAEVPEALAILRARRKVVPADCDTVFPGADGEPIRNHDKAWARIIRRAGLWTADHDLRPRPHDLRRTGGARMTSAEIPIQTITRALGNSPSSAGMVSRVYAQVADGALRGAFAATSRRRSRKQSAKKKS